PILFLTARNDAVDEARAFELGAVFLRKPFRLAPLREAMRELLLEHRLVPHEKQRILIVDDDPGIRDALRTIVEEEGFEPLCAEDGLAALDLAGNSIP